MLVTTKTRSIVEQLMMTSSETKAVNVKSLSSSLDSFIKIV